MNKKEEKIKQKLIGKKRYEEQIKQKKAFKELKKICKEINNSGPILPLTLYPLLKKKRRHD